MNLLRVEVTDAGSAGLARWLDIWLGERCMIAFGTYRIRKRMDRPVGTLNEVGGGQFSASLAVRRLARGFHVMVRTPRWFR